MYYVLAEAYGTSNVVGGPLGEMRGLREDGTRPADILVTDCDDTSIAVDVVVASPFTASLPVQREYASRPGLPARRAEDIASSGGIGTPSGRLLGGLVCGSFPVLL